MDETRSVWLLWHGDDIYDETPDAKLLGVYSSEERARDRIRRTKGVPGFGEHPDAFVIDEYVVDKDAWVDGFIRIDPDEWAREHGIE
ncbi:hypothetical protein BH20ACT7_BH20ACT7_02350 [soil metagenome]